jgi:peptidyl-prolyl cis-trans isomerase C
MMRSRKVPADRRAEVREPVIEQLIDRELMRQHLAERKAEPVPEELDAQVGRIRESLEKGGEKADDVLSRLGYTEASLREELALPLAWKVQVGRMVTDQRLRDYFRDHRAEFDGTRVRASQIFLRDANGNEEQSQEAERRLASIREEIVSGKVSFAEAARRYSQAPSAEQGGDVGFFTWRGRMPADFVRAVLPLKTGDVSEPFQTSAGWHLAAVTERKPGDLSLEDVRAQVLSQLSNELWDETVRDLRAKARIERK